jgi:tricorn protease
VGADAAARRHRQPRARLDARTAGHIVVRMNRLPYDERGGRPYLVPVAGGWKRLCRAGIRRRHVRSRTARKLVYTPIDRDFRSWKRYRGGRAQDVWIYDLAANTSLQLTTDRATDHQPMWIGDTIYFVSDRSDKTLNLYSVSPQGGEPTKLTSYTDFDVLWPSAGSGHARVRERRRDLAHDTGNATGAGGVPIRVAGDTPRPCRGTSRRPTNSSSRSTSRRAASAPCFRRARRDLHRAGQARRAAQYLDDARTRASTASRWSPDGKWIAYLSDATGEYEIYLRAQDGKSEPRRLTTDGDIWRFAPVWSPDSAKLAYGDKKQRLRIVDVASGALTEADIFTHEDPETYVWSPDSRWLAYVKGNASRNTSIWLYSLEAKAARQLTPDDTSETSPAFDPQGRYLYFLSNRDYNLAFSSYEFNFLYNNATRLYAATLAADGPALYRPLSDEVGAGEEKKDGNGKSDEKAAPKPLRIDLPGFNQRVIALNAPPGNYVGLSANEAGVFYMALSDGGPGELRFLSLDAEAKPEAVGPAQGYALSHDGSKLLLRRGDDYAIVDAKPKADFDAGKLDLAHMQLRIEPTREWRQLYVDGWRILRDWFYDAGMHGQDWNAIRAKYEALLPHVANRADLDYLLQEIAGEANAGHVYVESGDEPKPERAAGGLLGAELAAHESGYVRIAHIFPARTGIRRCVRR